MKSYTKVLFLLLLVILSASIVTAQSDNSTDNNQDIAPYGTVYHASESVSDNPIQTSININKIKSTYYSENVSINGNYKTSTGEAIKNTPINIKVNNEEYETTTDSKGVFQLYYKTSRVGLNNVTVSNSENNLYTKNSESITFNVDKQLTNITLKDIKDSEYSDNYTISGSYTDKNGVLLRWTPIQLEVNSNKYTINTDANGNFKIVFKAYQLGKNTVKVAYPGNTRYVGDKKETTFNVNAKSTIITVNNITKTGTGFLEISGRYSDTTNNSLRYTPLILEINDETFKTTTDNDGFFKYNYKIQKEGNYKFTVSYPGNPRYSGTSVTVSNNVTLKNTIIKFKNIETVTYPDYVSIRGKYADVEKNNLRWTPLVIEINGNKYTTKTDAWGNFNYKFRTNKAGVNNVTVSYPGNSRYNGASNTTQFTVKQRNTNLTINPIKTVKLGENTNITGRYTDEKGNPLRLTLITLKINENYYYARTDNNGYYQLNYKTEAYANNSIQASYAGTQNYAGTQTSSSFNVTVDTVYSSQLFKTRAGKIASVFVSGTVNQNHVTKWVNAGITDVYVRVKEATNSTSTLRTTINLCKNTNIKVHAWVIVFRDNQKWDYSTATQNKMKKFISQVMHIKGVEGICLDYIRYSGLNPKIVNTNMITNFVKDVNTMAKKYDSRMEVSVCLLPEIKSLTYYYGQDSKQLEKYCDVVILMAYKNNYYKDTQWMVDVTKELKAQCNHAKVVTSLTTYSDLWGNKYLSVDEIRTDINAVMKAGSYGYSLFSKSTTPVYPKITL